MKFSRRQQAMQRRDFLRALGGGAAALLAGEALEGCGGGGGGVHPSPNPSTLESARALVTASQGGTLTLPGGTSISFPAGTLPSDQTVTIARNTKLSTQPVNLSLGGVGSVLAIQFAAPSRAVPTAPAPGKAATRDAKDVTIRLNLAQSDLSRVDGSIPVMCIATASGPLFVGLPNSPPATGSVAAITLPANIQDAMHSAGVGLASTGLEISLLNVVSSPSKGAKTNRTLSLSPELRMFSSTGWGTAGSVDPKAKTLLLVHGMDSSVETAFPPQVANDIKSAGGYSQILGFNYNWLQHIAASGEQLAAAISNTKLQILDIEAHSLGTVVSLAALGSSNLNCTTVENLILLGGPLNGTPVADNGVALVTIFANIVESENPVAGLTLQALIESSSFTDVKTASAVLPQIKQAFVKQSPGTKIILAGGTRPRLFKALGDDRADKIGGLLKNFGGVTEPFDGLIPLSSAQGAGFPLPAANIVLVSPQSAGHEELEPNAAIMAAVGAQVKTKAVQIKMKPESWDMAVSENTMLKALPQDTSGKPGSTGPLTWKSSNESVATVDACGKVTAKSKGTVEITVTDTAAGIHGTAAINVSDNSTPALDLTGSWKGVFTSDNPVIGSGTITASLILVGTVLTGTATVVIQGQTNSGQLNGKVEGDTISAGVAYDTLGQVEYSGKILNIAVPDIQGLYAGVNGKGDTGTFNLVKE